MSVLNKLLLPVRLFLCLIHKTKGPQVDLDSTETRISKMTEHHQETRMVEF